jgi:hypothetical protein
MKGPFIKTYAMKGPFITNAHQVRHPYFAAGFRLWMILCAFDQSSVGWR